MTATGVGTANVVGITTRPSVSSTEFHDLTRVLSLVNWSIQVKTIVDTLCLPLSDALEQENTAIPIGTKASSFGHQTIGSFITSNKDKLGLGKDWTEWAMQVKALRLKTLYEIHSDNYKEIINQVEDVSKALGRIPASASEYHYAKDSILTQQRQDSDRRHQMQTTEMNERIGDLTKRLELERRNSSDQSQKTAELEAKLDSTLREMNQRLAEAQRNHDVDLERKLTSQRQELISSTQQQLEDMRRNADLRVQEAQERLDEMRSYYESSFVSKADHEIVMQQLERERNNNFDALRQFNEVSKSLDDALAQLSDEQKKNAIETERVSSLTRQVEQLNSRINTIARAPYIGESSEVAAELQTQIDELTLTLQNSQTQNEGMAAREKGLLKKLANLKNQLATVNEQNAELTDLVTGLRSRLKKAKMSVKLKAKEVASVKSAMYALGILLGVSALTTITLIAAS